MSSFGMRDSLLSGLAALRRGAAEGINWGDPAGDDDRVSQLIEYLTELQRWNRAYSLTAIDDPAEMVIKHILDSLAVAPWVHGRVLDVGTGAGLPGVPLAIMDPELDVTLMDATAKKVRFLNHVARTLRLQSIEPVHARVEEFNSLAPFDTVISRAFSPLAVLADATRHLLGPRSRLLGMKGRRPDDEVSRLPEWIGVEAVEKLAVPGLHEERHLVIMSLT